MTRRGRRTGYASKESARTLGPEADNVTRKRKAAAMVVTSAALPLTCGPAAPARPLDDTTMSQRRDRQIQRVRRPRHAAGRDLPDGVVVMVVRRHFPRKARSPCLYVGTSITLNAPEKPQKCIVASNEISRQVASSRKAGTVTISS